MWPEKFQSVCLTPKYTYLLRNAIRGDKAASVGSTLQRAHLRPPAVECHSDAKMQEGEKKNIKHIIRLWFHWDFWCRICDLFSNIIKEKKISLKWKKPPSRTHVFFILCGHVLSPQCSLLTNTFRRKKKRWNHHNTNHGSDQMGSLGPSATSSQTPDSQHFPK